MAFTLTRDTEGWLSSHAPPQAVNQRTKRDLNAGEIAGRAANLRDGQ
jgi:hypothetical protein